jgi:hypothetical protein
MRCKRRWDRSQYPPNWEEISYAFRLSKNFTCEACGYRQGDWLVSRKGQWYRGTVDAAHKYPGDTRNPHPELYCYCKKCHRLYDNLFAKIIAEGKRQVVLHRIVLERRGFVFRHDEMVLCV